MILIFLYCLLVFLSFSTALMTISLGRCTFPTRLLREVLFIVHRPFVEKFLPHKMTFKYFDMVPKSISTRPLTCYCCVCTSLASCSAPCTREGRDLCFLYSLAVMESFLLYLSSIAVSLVSPKRDCLLRHWTHSTSTEGNSEPILSSIVFLTFILFKELATPFP